MAKETEDTRVTVREVYALLNTARSDIMGSVQRLEVKLDTLESGRLTNIETKVANMEGRMMMVPLIISIAMNAFFFVVEFFLGKTK